MGMIKRCGLFVLLFGVSFIGLSGLFSDNVSAASQWDNIIEIAPSMTVPNRALPSTTVTVESGGRLAEILDEVAEEYNDTNIQDFSDLFWDRLSNHQSDGISVEIAGDAIVINIYPSNTAWKFGYNSINSEPAIVTSDEAGISWEQIQINYYCDENIFGECGWYAYLINNQYVRTLTRNWIYPSGPIYTFNMPITYPEGYEGEELPTGEAGGTTSEWTPDIKLLQGSDWLVELSDYNFFTFDKVAFTCGEHELAPVINWEVWDITEPEDRELIDTLIYGAPALVKYQAPKVQEDKRYEIVAYYSDCEGYTFAEASTKSFTVRKDGTLNKADYMVVCIREDFPFINFADCWAELNDFFTVLSFRVPDETKLGGGVFKDIPNGCRTLQVLDVWLFTPDQEICPQFSSETRLIITPFISFALGLMAVTFIARRQGIRSLN